MKASLNHGSKTVTTAGTAEQLTPNEVLAKSVLIQAKRANSGTIYVGNSTVSSTTHFVSLNAGNSVSIGALEYGYGDAGVDLSSVWLDTSNSGDGVTFGWVERDIEGE